MDIVEELRQNRDSGAKRLVSEYKAGLMSLARRFCVNESDAEELVNATFAKVVDNIDDYLEQSAFFAWMCQILTNLFRESVRRKSNANEIFPGEVPEIADDGAQEEIFRNLDHSLLRDAIQSLPKDMKEVIVMHYLLEEPVTRVAKFVGEPVSTVKWDCMWPARPSPPSLARRRRNPAARRCFWRWRSAVSPPSARRFTPSPLPARLRTWGVRPPAAPPLLGPARRARPARQARGRARLARSDALPILPIHPVLPGAPG